MEKIPLNTPLEEGAELKNQDNLFTTVSITTYSASYR